MKKKLKIYTYDRIAKMSKEERLNAIELVKTSDTLTAEEKRENLKKLDPQLDPNPIISDMIDGQADIDDLED